MVFAFSLDDWQGAVQELIRATKPGGCVELVEAQIELWNLGPNYNRWHEAVQALWAQGVDLSVTKRWRGRIGALTKEAHILPQGGRRSIAWA
ncbi:hypothetical protein BC936DRAFT_145073 [Jimgerdemannia flammicorona]|uniref:Methyltransferase type 11 domain-containing protein n=1 Tax=Jimgerdemannia flammicorona TaxID=994334 RepID=A0A433DB01_9FUNG|nr:hypothetical protein BC936DRAFT_145073 [Jimgerdemannia flammicorona]